MVTSSTSYVCKQVAFEVIMYAITNISTGSLKLARLEPKLARVDPKAWYFNYVSLVL